MITAHLYCYQTETYLNFAAEDAALMQAGDMVKVAFMPPDDAELFGKFEQLADGETVTLYRNSVWIQFKVMRREFFALAHSDEGVKTLTVHASPVSVKAYEALKLVQGSGRTEGR